MWWHLAYNAKNVARVVLVPLLDSIMWVLINEGVPAAILHATVTEAVAEHLRRFPPQES